MLDNILQSALLFMFVGFITSLTALTICGTANTSGRADKYGMYTFFAGFVMSCVSALLFAIFLFVKIWSN